MKKSFKIPFVVFALLMLGNFTGQAQSNTGTAKAKPATETTTVKKAKKGTKSTTLTPEQKAAKKAKKESKQATMTPEQTAAKQAAKAEKTTAAKPSATQIHAATKANGATKPVKSSTSKKAVGQGANTSTDKVYGKDKEGRTLYQGPKGGIYYINASGTKEYIKKDNQ